MDEDSLGRVLHGFEAHARNPEMSLGAALCATGVDVLDVDGAGLTLQRPGAGPVTIATSNADMAALDELELTLGEGPCVDAFELGTPVTEPDLAASKRWPAFTRAALLTPARAAFGYPLHLAGECFGALNLYATQTGVLTAAQHLDALTLAEVAIRAVLSDLLTDSSVGVAPDLLDRIPHQLEIHQATGMISVQLSIPIADALARLRAHAFAEGRPLGEVAAEVVARRLRFQP